MKKLKKLTVVWFSIGESDGYFQEYEENEMKKIYHDSVDELVKSHEASGHRVAKVEVKFCYPSIFEMED